VSVLLIAQESVTSNTITLIIVVLLVVAALLAVLTVVYWQRTDPRRRVPAQRRPAPASADGRQRISQPASVAPAGSATARPRPPGGERPTAAAPASSWPTAPAAAPLHDIEADEWLRLTGPQPTRRDGV
jgi:hypothetical protein